MYRIEQSGIRCPCKKQQRRERNAASPTVLGENTVPAHMHRMIGVPHLLRTNDLCLRVSLHTTYKTQELHLLMEFVQQHHDFSIRGQQN